MNDQPNREEAIVEAALALPPEQRAAYLDQSCGGDASLRQLVEALLHAHKQLGALRQQETATAPGPTMVVSLPPTEKPGDRIGRYKLLQQIGEGGCGVVYMAEQEEPVRRRVALKVIKLGMDTKQVIARFEAERQALALMDHPNIAKVLDGGATDTGRPYFVMELVKGIPITRYCDENKLDTRQRLDLFIEVCQAVQHAHQKGIIHRDIKPSNILVADCDGVPVPKVIDFGIAKATAGQTLTDKTVFTAFEQFIGTPAYMSPEQAKLSGLDIDTRSDIYSLGVLLYELLTGKTPFDAKRLVQAGLEEICRIIREEEPPRPSTKISTLDAAEQTIVARQRQLEPPKLVGLIRGDLDWIVMKTLEKDRNRRYETANGLAADLRRFLSEEAVVARPPSNLYRFQKLVRRNKLTVAAGGAVAAALILGLGFSTWSFLREREARRQAVAAREKSQVKEREARQSEEQSQAVLKFFEDNILRVARPQGEAGGLGKEITLRAAIDSAVPAIAIAFSNQPVAEANIRDTLGGSYQCLGDLQAAITQHERAVSIFRSRLGPDNADTLAAMNNLAVAYQAASRLTDAIPLMEETLARLEKTQGTDAVGTLTVAHDLAGIYLDAARHREAIALYEKTVKLRKAKIGPAHPETLSSINGLALAYGAIGRRTEALSLLEEIYHLELANLGPEAPATLSVMGNLANAYHRAGRFPEALALREEVFKRRKAIYGPDAPQTLMAMSNLAMSYKAADRLAEALPLLEEVLRLRRSKLGPDHRDTLASMQLLAGTYDRAGSFTNALLLYQQAVPLEQAKLGADNPQTLMCMSGLGVVYRNLGQFSNGVSMAETVLRLAKPRLGPTHPDTLDYMHNLASAYESAGRLPEALPLFKETLEQCRAKYGADNATTLQEMSSLAEAHLRAGQFRESENQWRDLLALQQEKLPADDPLIAGTLAGLAEALLGQSRPADAEPLARSCLAIRTNKLADDWRAFSARALLGSCLLVQKMYIEAEPLLISGYEGLKQREDKVPATRRNYLNGAAERLVQLYEAWGKPDSAADWKKKLAVLEKRPVAENQ